MKDKKPEGILTTSFRGKSLLVIPEASQVDPAILTRVLNSSPEDGDALIKEPVSGDSLLHTAMKNNNSDPKIVSALIKDNINVKKPKP